MPEGDRDLPAGWTQRFDATPDSRSGVTFEYLPSTDTRFFVTVTPQHEHPGYALYLSTERPESTQPAHEYYVHIYDRRKHALDGAHSLMDELTGRIVRGELSTSDPDLDKLNDAVQSVSTEHSSSLLDRLRTLLGNR